MVENPKDGYIRGYLFFFPVGEVDLSFTTEYKIYLAEDDLGKNEVAVGTASVESNHFVISKKMDCRQRNHLLMYASNPYGRAVQPAFMLLPPGCGRGRRLGTAIASSEGIEGNVLRSDATLPSIHKTHARNTTTNLLAPRPKPCWEAGGCILV